MVIFDLSLKNQIIIHPVYHYSKMMKAFKNLLFALTPKDILFMLKKIHYLRKIRRTSEEDEGDILIVKHIVQQGDHALDIGANIGIYSKFLSGYTGHNGKVYAFEPVPETYSFLEHNIKKLRLSNVLPLRIAVSDTVGNVTMEVPRYEKAGDNFYEARIVATASENLKSYQVECDTLEELYERFRFQPAFIKCDVEGFEWNVFKCSGKLLMECRPALLVEINSDLTKPDSKTIELLDYLKNSGYKIYINCENKLKVWHDEKMVNYFFLLEEHLSILKAKGLIKE